MYKEDFALNNLEWLICHKTQPIQQHNLILAHIFYLITITLIDFASHPSSC